jgi:A/G-specific adenine glycosylase
MPRSADSERALDPQKFRRSLQRWFRRHGRDLPWRRTRDPYAILVSEFMLQQTQVATVIPYYERWLDRFPDFAALAAADESDVLRSWEGLGYYARARNLRAAAKFVVGNFSGALPPQPSSITQLPGVGRYTAGAVASFAFDEPEPIVEANIARVLARLTNCQLPIDSSSGRQHLWETATMLLPRKHSRAHNSALMDLGALVCLPRGPVCGACPARSFCRAENPGRLPVKRKPPRNVLLLEPHAFIWRRNRILLEQSSDRWRGMWILPRLARRPKEEPLLQLDFPFTHHRVTLAVFARPREYQANERQHWFPRPALDSLPLASPHRRALDRLLSAERASLSV